MPATKKPKRRRLGRHGRKPAPVPSGRNPAEVQRVQRAITAAFDTLRSVVFGLFADAVENDRPESSDVDDGLGCLFRAQGCFNRAATGIPTKQAGGK